MTEFSELFAHCTGFEWDAGNAEKNWERHRVSRAEAEEVFSNTPFLAALDVKRSRTQQRFWALGSTNQGRRLFVGCTLRGTLIRVITARDMSRRERRVYAKARQANEEAREDS